MAECHRAHDPLHRRERLPQHTGAAGVKARLLRRVGSPAACLREARPHHELRRGARSRRQAQHQPHDQRAVGQDREGVVVALAQRWAQRRRRIRQLAASVQGRARARRRGGASEDVGRAFTPRMARTRGRLPCTVEGTRSDRHAGAGGAACGHAMPAGTHLQPLQPLDGARRRRP